MSEAKDPIEMIEEEIPAVVSPYEGVHLRFSDHFKISAYWFATNFIWGPVLLLMLPGELKKMVPVLSGSGTRACHRTYRVCRADRPPLRGCSERPMCV